jgi:predicted SnoaL-like aldol condensation-catalyzing enzyme
LAAALALLTVPLAGVAPAAAQSSGPAEDWTAVTSALDEGDVDAARATYEDRFQPHADLVPEAREAVEAALDDARDAEPGTPAYRLAAQVVEKGLLAVSYHAALDAADEGDADASQAWFDVLATKFDGDGTLAESKAAFQGVDGESLDDAAATLEAEYPALMASKVYGETEETPELLEAGQPGTAAKEAGEAVGYALGLQADLEAELGAEAADTLQDELGGLADAALAEDAETASAEATEILDLLATYGLATLPDEKVEAFHEMKDALDEGAYGDAEAAYEDGVGEHAGEYAPGAHERIKTALADARTAAEEDRDADVEVQHQLAAKGVLDVAWTVGFHELTEDEVHEALEHLAVVADKFGLAEDPTDDQLLLGHLAVAGDLTDRQRQRLAAGLAAPFVDKVYEEVDETFFNWDDEATAREKAIEGVAYYLPIQDRVAEVLSEDDADHLEGELRALYNATTARDKPAAEAAADEARELLDAYDNAGEDVSELDAALGSLERTLSIITVEIDEYVEYKEEGNDAKAQEEIEESKAFIANAKSTVEDHRDQLEARDAEALSTLEDNMDEIETRLEEERDLDGIPDLVDESVALLEAFEQEDPPEGPPVDLQVGTPEAAGDGFRVPVRLVGVPADGFSVQATVTYDPSQIEVREVQIPQQVGAGTVGEGEVRFNAASTDPGGETAVAAYLHAAPVDGADTASLDVTVETLTDAAGEDRPVGDVTGTEVELASDGGTAATPGFGLLAALVGLVAVARARC